MAGYRIQDSGEAAPGRGFRTEADCKGPSASPVAFDRQCTYRSPRTRATRHSTMDGTAIWDFVETRGAAYGQLCELMDIGSMPPIIARQ